MEKRHRCKLCFRNFANGRALGGHMRSHMMKFYEAKKQEEEQSFDDHDDFQSFNSYSSISPSSSSSSSSDEEEEEEEHEESEDGKALFMKCANKKSALLVDHEFSFAEAGSSVVLQDGESETESSKEKKNRPVCRRSKRVRKSRISDFNSFGSIRNGFFQAKKKSKFFEQEEQLSSISDITPEEHVAHCLMMLSRDNWKRDEREYQEREEEDYYPEDSGVKKATVKTSIISKVRGKYRCEECNKLFRSYQALGGHRASHNKMVKINNAATAPQRTAAPAGEKLHECPFCDRVFPSGQALGGHKRSHFIGRGGVISANADKTTAVPSKQGSRTGESLDIDLNLPAPVEDDSQVAVSVVSDGTH